MNAERCCSSLKEQLPYFIEGKARGEGKAEGQAEGLRAAIFDLCELLGIELDEERRVHLSGLELSGLEALRAHLKAHRSWP